MKLIVDSSVFIDAFHPDSSNHAQSLALLEDLRRRQILITMPAHGWFEVQCTLQRLIKEKRFVGPSFQNQMNYALELIHIDEQFIKKYAMADIPYIKAADHMFIAVAKLNGYRLVTTDAKMTQVSKQCAVQVFSPEEYSIELSKSV